MERIPTSDIPSLIRDKMLKNDLMDMFMVLHEVHSMTLAALNHANLVDANGLGLVLQERIKELHKDGLVTDLAPDLVQMMRARLAQEVLDLEGCEGV